MQRKADSSARALHCGDSGAGPISLPVLPSSKPHIRKSKNSPRRAMVLIAVQVLILAHIGLWLLSREYGWFEGKTLTPVEPSESMQTIELGAINAGAIFFGVILLSTLIFGRFFCGWACHIVMLQDFCAWIMKKCGVRPKPFRSRILVWAP
jgi:polyferredoxin